MPEGRHEARLQRYLIALALIVLPCAAGLYLWLPPSIDQWQLDYTGWLITRGEAPYLAIRDGNWPAAHWLHAISTSLSGPSFGGWRRFDLLLLVPSVWAGAFLCHRIWGRSSGYWFVLLYPCLYVSSGYWFAGQRDIVASHFGLIAMAAYWRAIECRADEDQGSLWSTLLAGFTLTLAILIKPTFGMVALVIAVHAPARALLAGRSVSISRAIRVVLQIAGWSLFALFLAGLTLWLQGTTPASFTEHAIRAILIRLPNDSIPIWESLYSAMGLVLDSWHWMLAGSLIATFFAIRSEHPQQRSGVLLIWLFVFSGFISFVAQGHGFVYYLAPVFLGLVLFSAGTLGFASNWLGQSGLRPAFAVAMILIALVGTGKKMLGTYGPLIPVIIGSEPVSKWESRFFAGDGLTDSEARELALEIQHWLPEQSTLFVWGRANVLNLLVRRIQPTGFYHRPHIARNYLPDDLRESWNAELMADLVGAPPVVALVHQSSAHPESELERDLNIFLHSHYRAIRSAGTSTLYVLKHAYLESEESRMLYSIGPVSP